MTIRWETIEIDSLDIFYYLQSDTQIKSIASSIPATELEYREFSIPDAPGDMIFFRIRDVADTTIYLDSPGYEIPSTVDAEQNDLVYAFSLSQNYPNPFNPSTEIRFSVPESQPITLAVYDITGRQVAVLVDDVKHTGWHKISFNASHLSSGLYVYQLRGLSTVQTKKMMLMK